MLTADFLQTNYVDLGTLTWYINDSDTYTYFWTAIPDLNYLGYTGNDYVCTKYKTISGKAGSNFRRNNYDKCIAIINDQGGGQNIGIQDSSFTSASAFKNAIKGQLLAYEKTSS